MCMRALVTWQYIYIRNHFIRLSAYGSHNNTCAFQIILPVRPRTGLTLVYLKAHPFMALIKSAWAMTTINYLYLNHLLHVQQITKIFIYVSKFSLVFIGSTNLPCIQILKWPRYSLLLNQSTLVLSSLKMRVKDICPINL